MFNWLRSWFCKDTKAKEAENTSLPATKKGEEWRLVHTIVLNITRATLTGDKEKGKFYYHLHESNQGNRRLTCSSTFPEITDSEAASKRFDDYHETVYPWLMGRYVEVEVDGAKRGVPTFNDVDGIDVQRKLSS